MQLISSAVAPARRPLGSLISATLVGATLVAGGLSLAYLAFATPLLTQILPSGRIGPSQMAMGAVVMGLALVAPATFVVVGANRLARLLASMRPDRENVSTLQTIAASMPEDVTGAIGVTLDAGRTIPGMLLGPFGVVVLRESPSPRMIRISGTNWEVRTSSGWAAIENPLDRATRDAERVRQWFSHADRDFLVKTYAALIVPPGMDVARTSTCVVLEAGQLPAFVASLPPMRSLTDWRREGLEQQLREALATS